MEDDDDARTDSRSQSLSQSQSQSQSGSKTPPPSPPSAHPITVVESSSGYGEDPGPSPSHHHSNGGRITKLVTVAASPLHGMTLALPIQQPRTGGCGGGVSGREDCWSEGATSTLIDAWSERYLELSRGNLKQKQWQEVADAVTSRDGYTKAPKTDVQCKNRIDTLKKKYKNQKAKIACRGGGGGGGFTSPWPIFHRLDLLLGPNQKSMSASAPPSQPNSDIPAGVPIRPALHPQFPQRQQSGHPPLKKKRSSPPSASSKSDGTSGDSLDGLPPPPPAANGKRQDSRGEEEEEGGGEGGGRIPGLRELTRAIARFGEVYHRVESSKLQQAMEMEKKRMSFAKELEVQRMQFFMKTQMELSQLKNHGSNKGNGTGGGGGSKKRRRLAGGDNGSGSGNHQFNNNSGIYNRDLQ